MLRCLQVTNFSAVIVNSLWLLFNPQYIFVNPLTLRNINLPQSFQLMLNEIERPNKQSLLVVL